VLKAAKGNSMVFTPNYRAERVDRRRAAQVRAQERQRKREEKSAQRKAEREIQNQPSPAASDKAG
jgi:hypothetical protein